MKYITKCVTCETHWKSNTINQANEIKYMHDVGTYNHYVVVQEV